MKIIIQARFSSKRLRGKVLKKIEGKPLLEYMVQSINKLRHKHKLIIATSLSRSDDKVVIFCKKHNIWTNFG